ncbi:MAG: hypothetical protein SGBAC_003881 [Bacillariaceae sp.]
MSTNIFDFSTAASTSGRTSASFDVMQDTTEVRRSLEQTLHFLACEGPSDDQQVCHEFSSTVHAMEQAISKEIVQQEEYVSSLLKSIELAISTPEHQSPKQEADFLQVAQTQVRNSKLLAANIKELAPALVDVAQLVDSKVSIPVSMGKAFQERLLCKPWTQASLTKIVVLYSDVFDALRDLKEVAKASGKPGVWVAPDSFERKTTKYWVPEENLPQLLMTCASEAPFLVYGKTGPLSRAEDIAMDDLWKNLSSQISSIYFDSPQLALYSERIKRGEGAQLLRARWYGKKPPMPNQPVFLELKTHHESWIQAKSVKERAVILEKDMNTFLYSMDSVMSEDYAKSLALAAIPKLKGKKLAKTVDLLLRMHTLVIRHKLRPCVRSTYDRLAFQSSKSNSLRLTLDRNVVVSDERGCKYGEQWYVPFSPDQWDSTPDGCDRRTIPFAVFEIKLGEGQESTALNECIDNGTILDAAKFSKFLTGAATFNQVNHLPYWADHPSFATFFYQSPSSLKPLPRDGVEYGDGQDSPTASASSVEVVLTPRETNQKKPNKFFSFFQQKAKGSTFVAPKKAVRIEPKTYFANERTFIQWVSAALFLVTTSALLLEFENGEGYAKTTATTLLVFAMIIAVYSIGLYYSRIWLMANSRPYGYTSHFGPFVLTGAAFAGTWIILSKIRHIEITEELERSIEQARNQVRFIQAEPGVCMKHDISAFSPLEFEPSDALVDLERSQLLVPSLSEIHAFPLPEWNSEGILAIPNGFSTVVAELELADFESATFLDDDTLYAISEIDVTTLERSAQMYSLERSDFGRFEITGQWKLETPEPEGMSIVSQGDSSSLLVSGQYGEGQLSAVIQRFSVPKPNKATNSPNSSAPTLEASRNLNEKLLDEDMEDPKIGAMTYFEGILYVLHDNARVVRAWDMRTGTLQSEWPLPGVPNSSGKQWEGLAFQRIERPRQTTSINRSAATSNPRNNLRRRLQEDDDAQATDDDPRWRDDDNAQDDDNTQDDDTLQGTDDDPRWRDDDTTPGTAQTTEDGDEEEEEEDAEEDEEDEEEDEEDEEEDEEDEEEEEDTSVLVLHLTHDTPAAVWSIVVKEGDVKGSIEYPACADVFR